MRAKVVNLDNKQLEEIEISSNIFDVELRVDILHRVVEWQRAKRRSGTHQVKNITEVSGTGKKPYAQKGTGRARLGSLRANQCRGGGIVFGPENRSHAYDLPKKVRKLGLKVALSTRFKEGKLLFINEAKLDQAKTKLLKQKLTGLGVSSVLIIDSVDLDNNMLQASANIFNVNLLPVIGANVYDILRHEHLIITTEAVKLLEGRLA